ncbi:hypothetical protein SERLA73DRAFT_77007 [Serpula lacrymans var. lacrymans S7.3]|uniref:Uncharacterized protein n=2 Tax=Serpula lacrymans var. lacrymans TaxID=341189 RepID=F8Q8T6_SERL3|nr:uncharacterized protein SERLADRAFT_441825 [Serpula lacrymans var. lacrymans S7.9]EGN94991.1 hypothetical protein SERLA73DRAFT_77007 [Serpula lacrymans var. lacrymans S7.3]EGO20485.1 hypothetical protein SERLADRAFT_441825 [Serpula lacrymans var. lacrymans S7.9]
MSSKPSAPAKAPSASNTLPQAAVDAPFIRFPPFPVAPEGASIISFSSFKPYGIQMFSKAGEEEEVELDGLNIPTVELRVKHDTDQCKSNKKRRKKKKNGKMTTDANGKRIPWWEEWEEGEELRVTGPGYDPNMSRVDRLFQAAQDFRSGRTWPPAVSGAGNLWDQFRLYSGLLTNTPVYRKSGNKRDGAESPEGFMSDEEDLDMKVIEVPDITNSKRKRPAQDSSLADDGDVDEEENETYKKKKLGSEEDREDRLFVFLDDPEISVKVFLSSFMREQGLIWSERNLITAPTLLSFFLNFLLRNRVFPEATHERGLRSALNVVEQAKKQLPLTFKIGKVIPDEFSGGCKECWGRKGGLSWQSEPVVLPENTDSKAESQVKDFETGLSVDGIQATRVEIPSPDSPSQIVKQIIEDNVGSDVELDISTHNPWANEPSPTATGAWGDIPAQWGPGADTGVQDGSVWDAPASNWADVAGDMEANAASSWSTPVLQSLMPFLGPTVLPLTHTTGIVEFSTRRIKAIHPPSPSPTPSKSSSKSATSANANNDGPDPEQVEDALDRAFAKVVLEPWIGCITMEDSDISRPVIKSSSRGAVVDEFSAGSDAQDVVDSTSGAKPYNPYKDDIVLLVRPAMVEYLTEGMGLGALWIQMVRQEGVQPRAGKRKGKQAGKENKMGETYWYLEDLMCIFPSFYTAREKAGL